MLRQFGALSRRLRFDLVGGLALLVAILTPGAVMAQSDTMRFDIPPGALGDALRRHGQISGRPLVFSEALVHGLRTPGLRGEWTPEAGLGRLLSGSGLTYERTRSGGLLIVPRPAADPSAHAVSPSSSSPVTQQAAPTEVDSVIITALKRPQAARGIPMSLSVIDDGLGAPGSLGLSDVAYATPGAGYNNSVLGVATMAIRGVATTLYLDRGQSPTGYFFDEVSLTDPYLTMGAVDLDTFDLDNVTVLRGPQTTVYGASAFAGAVNYQTAKPDLDHREGRVQVSASSTAGLGLKPSARGMLNVPLLPGALAVRASYVYRQDGGFVDNTGIGMGEAGAAVTRSGRVQVAWEPEAGLRLGLTHLEHDQETADAGYEVIVTPRSKDSVTAEDARLRTRLTVFRVDRALADGDLTLVASHRTGRRSLSASQPVNDPVPTELRDLAASRSKALEVRWASSSDRPFSALIGAVAEQARSRWAQVQIGGDPDGIDFSQAYAYQAETLAIFGEATFRPTAHWRVELGGRLSRITESGTSFVGTEQAPAPQRFVGWSATPRLAASWSPSERVTVYGVLSVGARNGGPNSNPDRQIFESPSSFDPDLLVNKEIGVRAWLFASQLEVDATLFHMDWRGVQLDTRTPYGFTYTANTARATSQGGEWGATWKATDDLQLRGSVVYLDAKLHNHDEAEGALTLPGASRWRTATQIDYRWGEAPGAPKLTLTHRYVSRAPSGLLGSGRQGGYQVMDGRLLFSGRLADVSIFVTNIGDVGGATLSGARHRFIEPPRRVGFSIDRRF